MDLTQTPAYNLKAVLKETGLSADTLRAWERRYGIPKPQRSPGGHRLYSQRDIQIIKWLTARQAEGVSISHAVELWSQLTTTGTDPLADSVLENESTVNEIGADALRSDWLRSCLAFDENSAEQVLHQAFALHPAEYVVTRLIQRGLSEMGELWYRGEASVQQEHFASGLALRRLEALIAAAPAPAQNESILLACPAQEWHTLPLVLLHLFLKRRGFPVIYLGANVPLSEFEKTMDSIRPNLIVLAAQQLVTAATLNQAASRLMKRGHQVAFGGGVFNRIPKLQSVIMGHFLGEGLETSVDRIENFARHPQNHPAGKEAASHSLAGRYRQSRSQIELALAEQLKESDMSPDDIHAADFYFGNALTAALELGDAAYLRYDLEWIKSLLVQHDLSAEHLGPYLQAYAKATRSILGSEGKAITAWIDSQSMNE